MRNISDSKNIVSDIKKVENYKHLGKCAICGSSDASKSSIRYTELEFCSEDKGQILRKWHILQGISSKLGAFSWFQQLLVAHFRKIFLILVFIAALLNQLLYFSVQYFELETFRWIFITSVLILGFLFGLILRNFEDFEIIVSNEDKDSENRLKIPYFVQIGAAMTLSFIFSLLLASYVWELGWLTYVLLIFTYMGIFLLWQYWIEIIGYMRILLERSILSRDPEVSINSDLYSDYRRERKASIKNSKIPFIRELLSLIMGLSFIFIAILALIVNSYVLANVFELLAVGFFYYDLDIPKTYFKKSMHQLNIMLSLVFLIMYCAFRYSIEVLYLSIQLITETSGLFVLSLLIPDNHFTHEKSLAIIAVFIMLYFFGDRLLSRIFYLQLMNNQLADIRDFEKINLSRVKQYQNLQSNDFFFINLSFTIFISGIYVILGTITSLVALFVFWFVESWVLTRKNVKRYLRIKDTIWTEFFNYIRFPSTYIQLFRWMPLILIWGIVSLIWLPGIDTLISALTLENFLVYFCILILFSPVILLITFVVRKRNIEKISFYQSIYTFLILFMVILSPFILPYPIPIPNSLLILIFVMITATWYFFYLLIWYRAINQKNSFMARLNPSYDYMEIHHRIKFMERMSLAAIGAVITLGLLAFNFETDIALIFIMLAILGLILIFRYVSRIIILKIINEKKWLHHCVFCNDITPVCDITCTEHYQRLNKQIKVLFLRKSLNKEQKKRKKRGNYEKRRRN